MADPALVDDHDYGEADDIVHAEVRGVSDMLSVTQAAAAVGLSPSVLRGYCAQGRVKRCIRIGNRYAIEPPVEIEPPARPVGRQAKG